MSVSTGTLITQGVLLALQLYRNHHGLPEDWTPTEDDWNRFEEEVKPMTSARFHEDAAATAGTPAKLHPDDQPKAVPADESAPTAESEGTGTS